jgi:hypothetical protein
MASLSLDVDNKWSYLKTHGDLGWETFPSYLDILVPRVLEVLAHRNLKITFFVVGQDAALEENYSALKRIADDGHEIANHSFSHEPWFHLYSREKIEQEIGRTEEHIMRIGGEKPVGFRGPGFSLSNATLGVLAERGYLYDASTFPTFIGPLARIYYFLNSNLNNQELKQRASLFGTWRDGLRPIKPYRWRTTRGLLEIPVTTMPFFRFPIHMSYVLYIATFSVALAMAYFRCALVLCRLAGVSPSLLLHPLDFLGQEDRVGLEFFPAMQLSVNRKLGILSKVLEAMKEGFCTVTVREHASRIAENRKIQVVRDYAAGFVLSPEK